MKKVLLFIVSLNLFIAPMIAQQTAQQEKMSKEDLNKMLEYQLYGIIAVQPLYRDYNKAGNALWESDDSLEVNNESRIGFRGNATFSESFPTFIWQIESGYVEPYGKNTQSPEIGILGVRDTFVGFQDDLWGKVVIGRVLTPLYELVDWPGSNPGLGDVYDWGSGISGVAYQDRQSNTIRWDSPVWSGFSLDIAGGRGDASGPLYMRTTPQGSNWTGAAAHYSMPFGLTIDAASEFNFGSGKDFDYKDTNIKGWNNQAYLAGLQGAFGVFNFWGQYKYLMAQNLDDQDVTGGTVENVKETQASISTGITLVFGAWQVKTGYAQNFGINRQYDVKAGSTVSSTDFASGDIPNTADWVASGQLLYNFGPAVLYGRGRYVVSGRGTAAQIDGADPSFAEYSAGVEYYF